MKKQRGFSLLEVMVSMLIIMFGMLGIAGMAMLAMSNEEAASYNGVAAVYASNLGALMQGNTAYWGTPPTSITISGATVTNGPAVFAGTCLNSACTANQIAYYDLSTWGTQLAAALPSGIASIACIAASSPQTCNITISWAEKNVALYNQSGSASGVLATASSPAASTSSCGQTHCYQTVVSIQP